LCDAFGIKDVVLCGPKVDLDKPRLRKAARATDTALNISQWDDISLFLGQVATNDYLGIALEYSTKSIAIDAFQLKEGRPILLFIGNEQNGVSQPILDWVDHTVHITMHGVNSSMNVIQATGIALYELTQKLLGQR